MAAATPPGSRSAARRSVMSSIALDTDLLGAVRFRVFCLKLDPRNYPNQSYISFITDSGPCQASVAQSSVALPPAEVELHMPYYTLSTRERSPPVLNNMLTIVCLSCGDTMKHFRTISKLGVRRERLLFVCPSCKGVDTKEVERVA
jgi:hypothetical protein